MKSSSWNVARRPFRDDRPLFLASGLLALFGLFLLLVNVRQYGDYHREVADIRQEIATLETRQAKAERAAQTAKAALSSYRLSALAEESQGILRIVAEHRFAWTQLLARLERVLPPEVGLASMQPRFDPASGETVVDLALLARNREAIVRTVAALSKDAAFGRVRLRSEAVPDASAAGDPVRFDIESSYHPEAR